MSESVKVKVQESSKSSDGNEAKPSESLITNLLLEQVEKPKN